MKIKRFFRRYHKFIFVFGLGMAFFITMMIFLPNIHLGRNSGKAVGLILSSPFIIAASIKARRAKKQRNFKEQHLETWLNKQYPGAYYDASGYFLTDSYAGSDWKRQTNVVTTKLFSQYNQANGGDYFAYTTPNGTPFQYCDLLCEERGDNKRDTYVRFDGGILATVCNKAKDNKCPLIIEANDDSSTVDTSGYNKISTENVKFNEVFTCYCSDQESFFFLITPHAMEKILALREQIGPFTIYLGTDGLVTISCPKFDLIKYSRNIKELKQDAINGINFMMHIAETIEQDIDSTLYSDRGQKVIPLTTTSLNNQTKMQQ